MKVSGGVQENGVVVGNTYDKYSSRNPIVKWLMRGFDNSLSELVAQAAPSSIHEVGCGEGYWVMRWHAQGLSARGCDFSHQVIEMAKDNASERELPVSLFEQRSIYELEPARDGADLVVCCEVLEHLEDPDAALQRLQTVVQRHLIVSVPREPIWCALNLVRGKYIGQWGNTPGHLQHWSTRSFKQQVGQYFDIIGVKTPLPWTLLLCRPKA